MIQLVWFKRDLRINDHAALWNAAKSGPVLAVYIFEPEYWSLPDCSQRQWAFTRESLTDLHEQLKSIGGRLLCLSGDATLQLDWLMNHLRIGAIHSHEETGNLWTYERDKRVKRLLKERGIDWHEYAQNGVQRPNLGRDDWAVYWNQWMSQAQYPIPGEINFSPVGESSELCTPLRLPRYVHCNLPEVQAPQSGGRTAGLNVMSDFLSRRGECYRGSISSPLTAENGCSRLSPYLATGCISMRELVQTLRRKKNDIHYQGRWQSSLSAFESRLWWHCHFIQKLEDQPDMEVRHLHPLTEQLNRPFDKKRFNAWKTGNTGWPMVDAAMRFLMANGWVNFRMRAMLVSVASYPLALPWQPVSHWLASLFTDYEPGIHYPQVQMQAGTTGINIPRIYNPVLQAQRLDPKGIFVRRWVPELRQVSDQWIFEPWLMPSLLQAQSDCRIGEDYPAPLVDFTAAARAARADLKSIRNQDFFTTSQQIGDKHGSRKRSGNVSRSGSRQSGRQSSDKKRARDAGQMLLF